MADDLIEVLVDRAHQIFNETSIFEVMDLNQKAARAKLFELYDAANDRAVDKYLGIFDQLREISS